MPTRSSPSNQCEMQLGRSVDSPAGFRGTEWIVYARKGISTEHLEMTRRLCKKDCEKWKPLEVVRRLDMSTSQNVARIVSFLNVRHVAENAQNSMALFRSKRKRRRRMGVKMEALGMQDKLRTQHPRH